MAIQRRLLLNRHAPHAEEAERMFAQNSEIYLPIQEKKKKRKPRAVNTHIHCVISFRLIAFVDVQNFDLFTIQGIGQPVDELVGKYQFRIMPVRAGLKKELVERLYTMGSKRYAPSGISGTSRPNRSGDRKPNSTELSGRAEGSQNFKPCMNRFRNRQSILTDYQSFGSSKFRNSRGFLAR
jgi:hypothetical protein